MITVNDILTQFQTVKNRFNELYTAITGAVDSDANLDGLTSTSKTSEYGKWMYIFSAMSSIMDSVWADRQKQISDKVDAGLPGTDRWMQKEMFKFQYGDTLLWNDTNGSYYYAVIDNTKQIIKRCAVISSGGVTSVKVATTDNANKPIPLTSDQLTAFRFFVNGQIQWAGALILPPVSFDSDKLDAPMTVYYDGTKILADIKTVVESAWNEYLTTLPFNAEYSINKHGDFVESKSDNIKEVNMGTVRARANSGSFVTVSRVYTPVSGYFEKDVAISFDTMITYVPL